METLTKPKRDLSAWVRCFRFPEQGEWTEEQVLALDRSTRRLMQFTNGFLDFLGRPTPLHQMAVGELLISMEDFAKSRRLGRVIVAPCPVRMGPGVYRMPDLIFCRPWRIRDVHGYPEGADLVVEVLSHRPESRTRDFVGKREEYSGFGIPEYWIVDPEQRKITVLTLNGKQYRVHGEFGAGKTATSVLLDGFAVSVDETFAGRESLELPKE